MANEENYKITIKGPGLSFDQPVDKAIANRVMTFVMTGAALPENGGSGTGGGGGTGKTGGGSGAAATNLKPREFIAQKKPSTQYERVACLAYYLTHNNNVTEFGTKEIETMNKDAAQQRILNPKQIVNDTMTKYGYLSAAGSGNKQITVLGENVVNALPDREAVKAAIAESRPQKKRARKAKKKKT
jgi:hypothetical protein